MRTHNHHVLNMYTILIKSSHCDILATFGVEGEGGVELLSLLISTVFFKPPILLDFNPRSLGEPRRGHEGNLRETYLCYKASC